MKALKFTLLISIAIILSVTNNFSEGIDKKKADKLLASQYAGTEYWFTIPPPYADGVPPNDKFLKLYIMSKNPTKVTVEIPKYSYKLEKTTYPKEQLEFILKPEYAVPYTKTGSALEVEEAVYPQGGIHVYADEPIIVNCIVKYKNTSDGFLVYPTTMLGTDYLVASYNDMTELYPGYNLPSLCGIVAAEEGTKITFTLGGNNLTHTAGGKKPGDVIEVDLAKGDVYMMSSQGDGSDLSGSKIHSNKPIAVIGANMCANVPIQIRACDYIAEMLLPSTYYGLNVHTPLQPNRLYAPVLRLFPRDEKTTIFKNGNQIGYIRTVGGLITTGYLEMRIVDGTLINSAVFSGDKPINIMMYNTGLAEDNNSSLLTDPFMMQLIPTDLYQKEITFCTPGQLYGENNFDEDWYQIVFENGESGTFTDDFQISNVVDSQYVWDKLSKKNPESSEIFSYNVNNKQYSVKNFKIKTQGIYTIKANTPFMIYQFGFSSGESYGYPAIFNLKGQFDDDTLPPKPEFSILCGNTVGGTVTDLPTDTTIRSNILTIGLVTDESFNYSLSADNITPGTTITAKWSLQLIDIFKDAKAVVRFTDRAGKDTIIVIEYIAPKLDIQPKSIEFGAVNYKQTAVQDIVLYNKSTNPIVISQLKVNHFANIFALTPAKSLPIMLAAGDSIEISLKFSPDAQGSFNDTLVICDSCICFEWLINAAAGEPKISVANIDFGSVLISGSSESDAIIHNDGTADLIITGIDTPTHTDFSILPGRVISDTEPLIILSDSSFSLKVRFNPSKEETYDFSLNIHSNAVSGDSLLGIKGKGGTTSVEDEFEKNSITSISPNPANHSVLVKFDFAEPSSYTVELSDISGNKVAQPEYHTTNFNGKFGLNINTTTLSAGIYMLKIITDSKTYQARI
ncbi:MAG: hypothetical protein QG635_1767, partial [Bacteroidota bacterium]|nr:hypothetical protein [Bacteroidota bacterium]